MYKTLINSYHPSYNSTRNSTVSASLREPPIVPFLSHSSRPFYFARDPLAPQLNSRLEEYRIKGVSRLLLIISTFLPLFPLRRVSTSQARSTGFRLLRSSQRLELGHSARAEE